MNNETIFNQEVAGLVRSMPKEEAIQLVQRYMQQTGFKSYYEGLESLGERIGMQYHVIEVTHPKTGKVTGFWPAIRYYKGNPSTGKIGLRNTCTRHTNPQPPATDISQGNMCML